MIQREPILVLETLQKWNRLKKVKRQGRGGGGEAESGRGGRRDVRGARCLLQLSRRSYSR